MSLPKSILTTLKQVVNGLVTRVGDRFPGNFLPRVRASFSSRRISRLKKPSVIAAALVAAAVASPPVAVAEWTGPCVSVPSGAPATASPVCHFWKAKVRWVDDGDTIDVNMATSTGKRKVGRVRIIGINAMEQTVYDSRPRKRRGECHALPATARLESLIKLGHGTVRLGAQGTYSRSRERLLRSVAVKIGGSWHDVGRRLLEEGHALWLPSWVEYQWNATYAKLTQQAALAHVNLWDPDACGVGPDQDAVPRLTVHPNGRGIGSKNANREWVTIENLGSAEPVALAGWWLRDSLVRFRFPPWVTLPPGGHINVHVGVGVATPDTLYWGLHRTIFDNSNSVRAMGDGAYLFDPQGDLRAWSIYPCYIGCPAGPAAPGAPSIPQ
jgi:micrococcal nuclease